MLSINQYVNGKVKSIGFQNASLGQASIGIILPGKYVFSINKPEKMTVITGLLKVLLPTAKDWQIF